MLCFAFHIPFWLKARPPQLLSAACGKTKHDSEKRIRFRPPVNDRLFRFPKKAIRSRSGAEAAPSGVLNTAKAAQPPPSSDSMATAWLMPRRAALFRPIAPEGRLAARRSRIPCPRKKAAICETHFCHGSNAQKPRRCPKRGKAVTGKTRANGVLSGARRLKSGENGGIFPFASARFFCDREK